jgi:uncharacterized SAM-binding protein YcdF (DUF218 family)
VRRALIVVAVLASIVVGLGIQEVLTPDQAGTPVGEAIIVHDGGHGERLGSGLALAANGAAPIVVVMNGETIEWPDGENLCDQTQPFIVVCPEPSPSNTGGEASEIRDLVDAQNWTRLVIVTSDYHLHRALMLDRKCAPDATLLGVGAQADIGSIRRVLLVLREVAALPQAWIAGCR